MLGEYGYYDGMLDFLNNFECRQLIFWTVKVEFPLNYTAYHQWNKLTGIWKLNSTYKPFEYIYERNGDKINNQYNCHALLHCKQSADALQDIWWKHPSQKPIRLMKKLVKKFSNTDNMIFDPFMGSGTTLKAAKELERRAIGIEISERYCEIAAMRLGQMELQLN